MFDLTVKGPTPRRDETRGANNDFPEPQSPSKRITLGESDASLLYNNNKSLPVKILVANSLIFFSFLKPAFGFPQAAQTSVGVFSATTHLPVRL